MSGKLYITIIISICLILGNSVAYSQDYTEKKTAFNSERVKLSNFYLEIAPRTNIAKLNEQRANIGVISAGFILNEKFAISYFTASSPKVNLLAVPPSNSAEYENWVEAGVELDKISASTEFVHVNYRHTGLRLNYMHRTDRILFWRTGFSAGFLGGLTLSENQSFLGLFNNTIYDEPVLSLSPEVGLGVNLLSWWRIHADIGFRFMTADKRIMSSSDASSFFASFSFGFGNFGK
jgi:hypothetical protein